MIFGRWRIIWGGIIYWVQNRICSKSLTRSLWYLLVSGIGQSIQLLSVYDSESRIRTSCFRRVHCSPHRLLRVGSAAFAMTFSLLLLLCLEKLYICFPSTWGCNATLTIPWMGRYVRRKLVCYSVCKELVQVQTKGYVCRVCTLRKSTATTHKTQGLN